MDIMFWVWLGVIALTAVVEFATMELVSIWFTFGAIIPFVLASTGVIRWEIQLAVFVIVSAVLIVCLRKITKKYLLKNSEGKTNLDNIIGKQYRMLEHTDFDTVGSVKINDVVWSAVAEDGQLIEKGEIVEVVKIQGNKILVKKVKTEEADQKAFEIEQPEEKKLETDTQKKKTTKTDAKTEQKPVEQLEEKKPVRKSPTKTVEKKTTKVTTEKTTATKTVQQKPKTTTKKTTVKKTTQKKGE